MSKDLSPEEYLAQLNARSSSGAHHTADSSTSSAEASPYDPAGVLQPGQTLREVLSDVEIEGLRAFARRTGGADGERAFDAELDTPWEPDATDALIEQEQLRRLAGLEQRAQQRGGGRRAGAFIGIVAAVTLVIGVVAVGAALTGGDDDDRAESLAEASGVQRDRGEEAVAAAERFTVPETWTERAEPEISMSGDEESSYAFYNLAWDLPRRSTVAEFEAWFRAQPEVESRRKDATCQADLAEEEATCEVELYERGVDGERDYDTPHQTVSFNFLRGAPSEGAAVFAEVYASD